LRVFVEIEMIIEFTGSEGTDHDGLSATVGRSDEYHVVKFYNNDIEVADLGRLVICLNEAISLALEFITGEMALGTNLRNGLETRQNF